MRARCNCCVIVYYNRCCSCLSTPRTYYCNETCQGLHHSDSQQHINLRTLAGSQSLHMVFHLITQVKTGLGTSWHVYWERPSMTIDLNTAMLVNSSINLGVATSQRTASQRLENVNQTFAWSVLLQWWWPSKLFNTCDSNQLSECKHATHTCDLVVNRRKLCLSPQHQTNLNLKPHAKAWLWELGTVPCNSNPRRAREFN